jgi:hypothetical protein
LEAFTPEQAAIYFGRGLEVDQLLQQFTDPKVRFVAVVGVSGSGKSSLVKVGLLPRLRSGVVGHAPWLDVSFKPGERCGNPFLVLAVALKSKIIQDNQTDNEMARVLRSDLPASAKLFGNILADKQTKTELLLVIDQFEELFAQCNDAFRNDFLITLAHWLALPGIRAIVTLRADFYARAIAKATLAKLLRQDRCTFRQCLGAIH